MRPAPANRLGGDEALVGVRGRHANVDDCDVGRLGLDAPQEFLGRRDLRHHVEVFVCEQARDALSQQHRVVRDHDAHGISAWMCVPPPRGTFESERRRRVRGHGRRDLGARIRTAGSAPPTPLSSMSTTAFPSRRVMLTSDRGGVCVLRAVRERLRDEEVGGCLDWLAEPLARARRRSSPEPRSARPASALRRRGPGR